VFVRPKEGFWGNPPIWAPEVHKLDGAYCMFATFTGRDAGRGSQILRSESPEGPLVVFHRMKNGKLVIIWSSFVKGHGYGMGQAISESGTIAGPWRHMEKPFFGGGGEDGGYGMILGDFSGELLMAQLPNDGRKALVSECPSHFSLLLAPGNPTRSREQ
jgi:GH43 family beta-xylosidase